MLKQEAEHVLAYLAADPFLFNTTPTKYGLVHHEPYGEHDYDVQIHTYKEPPFYSFVGRASQHGAAYKEVK